MDKEYLINKWLKDELTEAEKQVFYNLDDALLNYYIIENAKCFKASNVTKLDNFNTFKARYKASNNTVKQLYWFKPLLKIAGVIVIALGIYFTFFFNNNTIVETLASQKTRVELPDHSQVELNALSSIEYNRKNWNDNRILKLKGEAYFKVASGKTFNVKTSSGTVTVIGTQFNVKQRNKYFEVKCFEGIVKVVSDTIVRQLLACDAYQMFEGKITEGKTTTSSPRWTNNMSEFNAIPIKEVLSELERQYNIEVTYRNIDVNRLFTGGFHHDHLEKALIAITQPMNMTYELSSSNLVIIHGKKH